MMAPNSEQMQLRLLEFFALAPADKLIHVNWLGCIRWAMGDACLLNEFRKETGVIWRPSTDSLEMILNGSPAAYQFLLAFAQWVNKHIWGECEGRAISERESSSNLIQ